MLPTDKLKKPAVRVKAAKGGVQDEPAVTLGGGGSVVPVEMVKPAAQAPKGNLPADNLLPQGQPPLATAPAPTPAPPAPAATQPQSKYNIRSRLNQLRMPGRRAQ